MRYLKYLVLVGIFLLGASYSHAQVSVGIGIGPVYGGYVAAPVCPYGYYDYYPYGCAPYGYWGPRYFVGGEFIGVGPWYRGHFDRDRYWGDRDRYYGDREGNWDGHDGNWGHRDHLNHGRGFAYGHDRERHLDRGRDNRYFDRGANGFNNRGDNHFDRGNRNGQQFFSPGDARGGNSFRGDRGRGSFDGGRFRGGDGFNNRGDNHFDRGNSRGGNHGWHGDHGGGHGRH